MHEWKYVMRRCTFKQRGGGILRLSSSSFRYYTRESPVTDGGVLRSEDDLDDAEQRQNAAVRNIHTSSDHDYKATNTSKPSTRRPLPLSPLMDPTYRTARQKYRLPKAARSNKPTPFQQLLAKNPYARALDTPLRWCQLTRTHLPSFFLQDFELIAHPSSNEPWYLPRSLVDASPSTRPGRRTYILSRASLLRAIRTPNSGYANGERKFMAEEAKKWKPTQEMKKIWRADMDTFVLELMRRRVVEGLRYLCGRKRGYLIACNDWEYAKACKQVGAFLWLGPSDPEKGMAFTGGEGAAIGDGRNSAQGSTADMSPGEFATLDMVSDRNPDLVCSANTSNSVKHEDNKHLRQLCWHCNNKEHLRSSCPEWFATCEGKELSEKDPMERTEDRSTDDENVAALVKDHWARSKIPVHNLQHLLGSTHVEGLRRDLPFIFNQEVVAVKNRNTTIDTQLRLWKLQGYLAEHIRG